MSGPTITQRRDGTTSLRFPFDRWLVDELKAQIPVHARVDDLVTALGLAVITDPESRLATARSY